jgi:hypothetical protein
MVDRDHARTAGETATVAIVVEGRRRGGGDADWFENPFLDTSGSWT